MMSAFTSHYFTPEKLYVIFRQLTEKNKVYIAYSGGVDSHVLLHGFCQLRLVYPQLQIFAIHINHGLCAGANDWQEHCQKICGSLDVSCLVRSVAVKDNLGKKQSVEAVARHLRYQAFADVLPSDAVLMTAHHADDQVETLLLQLLRGAGPKGLAAIPAQSKFAEDASKELLRPLLKFSRQDILQYAQACNLEWIEDDSNRNLGFERNYLRQQIMPLMKNRWPGILETLGRVATNCYETNYLAEALAAQDYVAVRKDESKSNILVISKLLELDPLRQRNLLRYFLQQLGLPVPSRIKIEQVQKDILHCAHDAQPVVAWAGAEVRRYQDCLYAMEPLPVHDSSIVLSWDLSSPLTLPSNLGTLVAKGAAKGKGFASPTSVSVRFRQGGERCQPRDKTHHCVLAKLMQEWQIPPWLRGRIPLIYRGDELVMVVGYCQCGGWDRAIEIGWL